MDEIKHSISRRAKTKLNLQVDIILLVAGLMVFISGLVLFFSLHIGLGSFQTEAFGISRLSWINIHRLTAVVLVGATMLHCAFHAEIMTAKIDRALRVLSAGDIPDVDIFIYLSFFIVIVCSFVAWCFVPGSSPILGPATLGELPTPLHTWIDVHNISGLFALVLCVYHAVDKWDCLANMHRATQL